METQGRKELGAGNRRRSNRERKMALLEDVCRILSLISNLVFCFWCSFDLIVMDSNSNSRLIS